MPLSKIVQDSVNGGVAGTGPAFSASSTGNALANNVWTKVLYDTLDFDTNNYYSRFNGNATFNPKIAGYYYISAMVVCSGAVSGGYFSAAVYKNGSPYNYGPVTATAGTYYATCNALVYCNGSTDYVEIYAVQTTGSSKNTDVSTTSKFQGFMVRAA